VAVEIGSESVTVDAGGAGKDLRDLLARSEPSPPHWDELADGHAAPSHDEGLALIQATHDLAAAVAKFTLRNRPTHYDQCSTSATVHLSDTDSR
jgi:hypothetical protein